MLTEGPQEDVIPPVQQQQQQHEMPAQNEPVHDNTAGGDQGVCARALYDYQAGECRGAEWTATLCIVTVHTPLAILGWPGGVVCGRTYCCVNMFVILLSVGILLLCKHVCHFIVCGHTYCCGNMFVILLSVGIPNVV